MILGAILEAIGIGAILPLISIMGNPDFLTVYPKVTKYAGIFGIMTHIQFIITATFLPIPAQRYSFGALAIISVLINTCFAGSKKCTNLQKVPSSLYTIETAEVGAQFDAIVGNEKYG